MSAGFPGTGRGTDRADALPTAETLHTFTIKVFIPCFSVVHESDGYCVYPSV